jgi:hypothetical protein
MKNTLLTLACSTWILLSPACSRVSQNVSGQVHTVQIHDVGLLASIERVGTYLQSTEIDDFVLTLRLEELAIQIQRYKVLVWDSFWEKDFSNILKFLDIIDAQRNPMLTLWVRKLLTKDLKS